MGVLRYVNFFIGLGFSLAFIIFLMKENYIIAIVCLMFVTNCLTHEYLFYRYLTFKDKIDAIRRNREKR